MENVSIDHFIIPYGFCGSGNHEGLSRANLAQGLLTERTSDNGYCWSSSGQAMASFFTQPQGFPCALSAWARLDFLSASWLQGSRLNVSPRFQMNVFHFLWFNLVHIHICVYLYVCKHVSVYIHTHKERKHWAFTQGT